MYPFLKSWISNHTWFHIKNRPQKFQLIAFGNEKSASVYSEDEKVARKGAFVTNKRCVFRLLL